MAVQVLQGCWIGYAANECKREEDSALAGVNRVLTLAAQVSLVFNAVYISQLALQATPLSAYGHFTLGVKVVLYLTPVVTNLVCAKFKISDHPTIKRTFLSINAHIGSLCQLAVAVSAITLIVFGQPIVGGVSLAFVIAGFAQRRCWLPTKLSQAINTCGFVGINKARLVLGNSILYQITALCEITNFVYLKIARLRKSLLPIEPNEELSVSIADAPNIFRYKMNERHLVKDVSPPPPPDIHLESLKTNFSRFNLEDLRYFNQLKNIVERDEHWQEYFADRGSSTELIEYIRNGLNQFIENITNRTIRSGEINDYRSLQSRAKHIAYQLPQKSDEEQFIHMVHLALASYYCPAGYLEKVRSVYYTVCDSFEEDSLEARVDQVLDHSRRYLFQVFMHQLWANNPIRHLTDPEDNHIYSEFVNLLGEFFHLSEVEDAQQDSLSYVDIFSKKFLQLLYRPLLKPFIESYNTHYIIESIEEGLTNGQLPHELMERWFLDEYLKVLRPQRPQNQNESERDYNQRLIEEATGWVRGNVYDIMTGKIERSYLSYFLAKMSVIKPDL